MQSMSLCFCKLSKTSQSTASDHGGAGILKKLLFIIILAVANGGWVANTSSLHGFSKVIEDHCYNVMEAWSTLVIM